MKKVLLAVVAFAVLGITSCKKEEGAQPDANNSVKIENKKDLSQWD